MTDVETKHVQNKITIEDEFNGEKQAHILRHFGELKPIEEIDASEYNHEHMMSNFVRNNRPLVIRNALKTFDVGTSYSNWSLNYLLKKCGTNRVHVRRNTNLDTYKTGQAYFAEEVEFQTYVRDLLAGNELSKNSYLAVQNLKKAFPEIYPELKVPPFVERVHGGPYLWIARPGHYEYCHMDPDDNVLSVYSGRKLVRLYGCDVNSMKPNKLGSNGRTIQSQINCDDEDLDLTADEFEKFKQNTCHYCLLKDGDLLYFPAFWWHQVTTPILTISVNFFFGDGGLNNFTQKMLDSAQRDSFLYWMFNIIKQNTPFASFSRMLVYLRGCIKYFLYKQWHDTISPEQIEDLYQNIVKFFGFEDLIKKLELEYAGVKVPANPSFIRIRGLLHRSANENEEQANAY